MVILSVYHPPLNITVSSNTNDTAGSVRWVHVLPLSTYPTSHATIHRKPSFWYRFSHVHVPALTSAVQSTSQVKQLVALAPLHVRHDSWHGVLQSGPVHLSSQMQVPPPQEPRPEQLCGQIACYPHTISHLGQITVPKKSSSSSGNS